MTEVVHVLDARKWNIRLLWTDLLALGVLIVLGATVFFDMYWLGHTAYYAANIDAHTAIERDRVFARMIGELAVLVLAFGWVAFRTVTGAYRGLALRD